MQLVQPRDPGRRESDHALDGKHGEGQSERAARNGQQDPFRHLLERDPAANAAFSAGAASPVSHCKSGSTATPYPLVACTMESISARATAAVIPGLRRAIP